MEALSALTSEVKFRERKRGYDYEEVDNFVQVVGRAAVQAQNRIADLERRLAQAGSSIGDDGASTEIRETLLRTLVLAQRTADSAVSEAKSEAGSIIESAQDRATKTVSEAETAANERLRSAEERAERVVAESEESGQLIIDEAKRTAAAELATERERARAELHELETSRNELQAVVTDIQTRLDSERASLRGLAESFHSFVEKLQPVALTEPVGEGRIERSEPATSAHADASVSVVDDAPTDPDPRETLSAMETLPTGSVDIGAVPDMPMVEWADDGEKVQSADLEPVTGEPVASDVIPMVPAGGGEAATVGPATMPFGMDSPELFDIDADDDGFIEQLREVVSSDGPTPEDAAMAAFFDHDEQTASLRAVSAANPGSAPGRRNGPSGRGAP